MCVRIYFQTLHLEKGGQSIQYFLCSGTMSLLPR